MLFAERWAGTNWRQLDYRVSQASQATGQLWLLSILIKQSFFAVYKMKVIRKLFKVKCMILDGSCNSICLKVLTAKNPMSFFLIYTY